MRDCITKNLWDFGPRELAMAAEILVELSERRVPDEFENDQIEIYFNRDSGYVFLTDNHGQAAVMHDGTMASMTITSRSTMRQRTSSAKRWDVAKSILSMNKDWPRASAQRKSLELKLLLYRRKKMSTQQIGGFFYPMNHNDIFLQPDPPVPEDGFILNQPIYADEDEEDNEV